MKEGKSLLLLLGAVIIVLIGVNIYTKGTGSLASLLPNNASIQQSQSTPVPQTNQEAITVGSVNLTVTIADNDQTRAKGLGGVTNLPQNEGMLFVFPTKNLSPEQAKFWMKDMQIPLDFIWISNNKVAEITPNIPAPPANTPDTSLQIYAPDVNIDYVLETNSGFALANNIKVGDPVTGIK